MLLILLLKSPLAAFRILRAAWRLGRLYGTVQLLVLVPLVIAMLLLPLAFPAAHDIPSIEAGGAASPQPALARRQDASPGLLSASGELEWGANR